MMEGDKCPYCGNGKMFYKKGEFQCDLCEAVYRGEKDRGFFWK